MAKASAQITLHYVIDVKAVYRYYLLQSSTLAKPSKPTTFPPSSSWDDTEPAYVDGSTNSLYFVDCTVFADDTFSYTDVSLSSSYEAAKSAYNKAVAVQNATNTAIENVDTSLREAIQESSKHAVDTSEDMMLSYLENYATSEELEELKNNRIAQLEMKDSEILMTLGDTVGQINNVNGELQLELTERKKHITYGADNAIFIGGSLSGITLTVDNDNGIIFSRIISRTDSTSGATEVLTSSIQYQIGTSNTTAPAGEWLSALPKMSSSEYLWIRKTLIYTDNTTCVTDSVAFGAWDGNDFYTGNIIIRVDERAQFGEFAYFPRPDKSLILKKVGG